MVKYAGNIIRVARGRDVTPGALMCVLYLSIAKEFVRGAKFSWWSDPVESRTTRLIQCLFVLYLSLISIITMDYDDDYDRCREELTDEEEVRPKKKSNSSTKNKITSKSSSKSKTKPKRKVREPEETEAEENPEAEEGADEEEEEDEMAKLDEKIGFMGGGMMAYAIASGMVNRGIVKPNQILASGPHPENLERWKEMGAAYTTENEDVSK